MEKFLSQESNLEKIKNFEIELTTKLAFQKVNLYSKYIERKLIINVYYSKNLSDSG